MIAQCNIIEGAYLQDILQQPEALRQSVEGFMDGAELREFAHALARGEYKHVVLTGMGGSLHALYSLHLTLTNRGFPSLLVETSELIHYLPEILSRHILIVAVSQSGQSAEMVRLLGMTTGQVPVIGVTNSPDSDLARCSTAHVPIRAGHESSVSCKTYVCSLLALEWLGAILSGGNLARTRAALNLAIPAVEEYLRGWRQHVEELCGVLADINHIFVTGRGPSISTALTGGLILKESAHFPAEGMSSAAFRHGPFEALASHVLVVVLAGDSRSRLLNRRLGADVQHAGGKLAFVDTDANIAAFRIPELPDSVRPVVEILPVQMISLALAARSGREAGRFELASKVTLVE